MGVYKMVDRSVRDAEARKLKELYEAKKSQEEIKSLQCINTFMYSGCGNKKTEVG